MRTSHKLAAMLFVAAIGTATAASAESTGQFVDDASITTKVKAALLADKQLKATDVSVETTQGAVKLSGSVPSKDQETLAVKDANQVSGVKSVNDLLEINATNSTKTQEQ